MVVHGEPVCRSTCALDLSTSRWHTGFNDGYEKDEESPIAGVRNREIDAWLSLIFHIFWCFDQDYLRRINLDKVLDKSQGNQNRKISLDVNAISFVYR